MRRDSKAITSKEIVVVAGFFARHPLQVSSRAHDQAIVKTPNVKVRVVQHICILLHLSDPGYSTKAPFAEITYWLSVGEVTSILVSAAESPCKQVSILRTIAQGK